MTPQANMRRIGWLAALAICTALYLVLHLKVHSVTSEVVKSERQIIALEERNMLLETEFLTRSSQIQLASWNRVDFGYQAPDAYQFIGNERQLGRFSSPRAEAAPEPIRIARLATGEETQAFPQLVSPLTGQRIDAALVEPAPESDTPIVTRIVQATLRVPLDGGAGRDNGSFAQTQLAQSRIAAGGGAGQ